MPGWSGPEARRLHRGHAPQPAAGLPAHRSSRAIRDLADRSGIRYRLSRQGGDAKRAVLPHSAIIAPMSRAVTVRLDEADHMALEKQANELRVRPGTLARILVHAGLSGNIATTGNENARAALDRLVERSRRGASADAVELVAETRLALITDQ